MNHVSKLYSIVLYWLKSMVEANMSALGSNYDVILNNVG